MIRPPPNANYFSVLNNRYVLMTLLGIVLICTWISTFRPITYEVVIDLQVQRETDEKFLSFALDTSFINTTMKTMTKAKWKKVGDITSKFSPAYLRLGGTMADKLIFDEFPDSYNDLLILTQEDWKQISEFTSRCKLRLLFDFNVLLRNGGHWHSDNAKKLLDFTRKLGFKPDFQLGNEPNSFLHVFNYSLSPEELAGDFLQLRNILNSNSYFAPSLLVGPDVTNPRAEGIEMPSLLYLDEFLNNTHHILDAVTWHQYYLNGRTAILTDFLSFDIMEDLSSEIDFVAKVVSRYSKDLPIWLSETGSAYGGGAPELSNRFVSTFLFLDKLGLAARKGIKIVMRQSLIKGHYGLINQSFGPTPDFWIGYMYKKVVGTSVYNVTVPRKNKLFRIYAHNTVDNIVCTKQPFRKATIVVFAINISDIKIKLNLNFRNRRLQHCATYIFSAPYEDLKSESILMNAQQMKFEPRTFDDFLQKHASSLDTYTMRPYTLNFWLFA